MHARAHMCVFMCVHLYRCVQDLCTPTCMLAPVESTFHSIPSKAGTPYCGTDASHQRAGMGQKANVEADRPGGWWCRCAVLVWCMCGSTTGLWYTLVCTNHPRTSRMANGIRHARPSGDTREASGCGSTPACSATLTDGARWKALVGIICDHLSIHRCD